MKAPPKEFRDFEVRKSVRSMFWRPNDSMKAKFYVFSSLNKDKTRAWFLYSQG